MPFEDLLHFAQDSVVVESFLPGVIGAVVRGLFGAPQWVQIVGFLGVVAAVSAALVFVWHRRVALTRWVTSRSQAVKISLSVIGILLVLSVAGVGTAGWDYMQHDNGFCNGCHVMEGAFTRFAESEHNALQCHDCHQQSTVASMRQLYLWVAERPDEIGEHAPVPNSVCEECHVTGEPEVWQRIASTAGHRAHLESDSAALDDLLCVNCHGIEVHRFAPVDETCAQADCHVDQTVSIGAMENQSALHCVTCHEFTLEVAALATRDSAAAALTPGLDRCSGCHEMREVIETFDSERDPHSGQCGYCHKPHEQVQAEDAAESCATAECHADWENEPFHVGTTHRRVGSECLMCHVPHDSRVDASGCEDCHVAVSERPDVPPEVRRRLRRAEPFDTMQVIRSPEPEADEVDRVPLELSMSLGATVGFWGVGWLGDDVAAVAAAVVARQEAPQDSFAHAEHESLTCLTCHQTTTDEAPVRFEVPRGCQICHHQAPSESDCSTCHPADDVTVPTDVVVVVSVRDAGPRLRDVAFRHDRHEDARCVDCHVEPVTLGAYAEVVGCTDCHGDHHAADRDCRSCHGAEGETEPHAPPDGHSGCDACHPGETVALLLPDRQFCLTCHPDHREHYLESPRECSECHFLATPDAYRERLRRPSRGDA